MQHLIAKFDLSDIGAYIYGIRKYRNISPNVSSDSSPTYGIERSPQLLFSNNSLQYFHGLKVNNHINQFKNTVKFDLNNNALNGEFLKYMIGFKDDDLKDMYVEAFSASLQNYDSGLYNTTLNINLTYLNMATDNWIKTMSRINETRYSIIFNKKESIEQRANLNIFFEKIKEFNPEFLKNIIIYSGSALLVYGLTYTKDIDIIVFNTPEHVVIDTFGKLGMKDVDVCYYHNNEFYRYKCDSKEKYKLHHNSSALLRLLDNSFYKTNILFETPTFQIECCDYESNCLLDNSIIVNGIKVLTLDYLDKFYKYRYLTTSHEWKSLVLIDMYYLRTYAKTPSFQLQISHSEDNETRFNKLLQKYEKTTSKFNYTQLQNVIKAILH